ncbi:unnamed protein product [Amoebophrya sp. A120]|nr:unnamed protein product [Amoebophrya sp. A120]|eukprot:GSA120T00000732001.1
MSNHPSETTRNSGNKHARPYVNDYDLVESLPGAQCDCTGPQRAEFVTRAKKLWEMEKQEDLEQQTRTRQQGALRAEREMETLCEMFPLLEKALVHSLYCELHQDMNATIEQCVSLCASMESNGSGSGGLIVPAEVVVEGQQAASSSSSAEPAPKTVDESDADFFSAESRQKRKAGLVVTGDWPALTNADGWEVCNAKDEVKLEDLAMDETDAEKSSWSQVVKAAKDLPDPRYSGSYQDYDGSCDYSPKLQPCQYGKISPKKKCDKDSAADDEYDYYKSNTKKPELEDWELRRSRGQASRDKRKIFVHPRSCRAESMSTDTGSGVGEEVAFDGGEMGIQDE